MLIDPRRGIELSGGSPPRLARAGPENLNEGDVILKGANALDLTHRQAAVLIGHPKGGIIGASLQAVVGERRVRIILPVGLEKRAYCDLMELATGMTFHQEPMGQGFCPCPEKSSLRSMPSP